METTKRVIRKIETVKIIKTTFIDTKKKTLFNLEIENKSLPINYDTAKNLISLPKNHFLIAVKELFLD